MKDLISRGLSSGGEFKGSHADTTTQWMKTQKRGVWGRVGRLNIRVDLDES